MSTPFLDALNALGASVVRLYKLHETSGTVAVDASGNIDGTYLEDSAGGIALGQTPLSQDAGASSVYGGIKNLAARTGSNGRVQQSIEGLYGAPGRPPITIVAMFKTDIDHTGLEGSIAAWARESSSRRTSILGFQGNKLALLYNNSNASPNAHLLVSNSDINDGLPHLAVAVLDANSSSIFDRRLYLDGALVASSAELVDNSTSGTNFNFDVMLKRDGAETVFSDGFGGYVEYAVLINRALTTSEVEDLHAAFAAGATGPTITNVPNMTIGIQATITGSGFGTTAGTLEYSTSPTGPWTQHTVDTWSDAAITITPALSANGTYYWSVTTDALEQVVGGPNTISGVTGPVITDVTDGVDRIFEVSQTGIQVIGTGFGADPNAQAPQTVINLQPTVQTVLSGLGFAEEIRSGYNFSNAGILSKYSKLGDLPATLDPITDQWATAPVDGSLYELLVTQSSGSVVSGLTLDVWMPLDVTRTVYLSAFNGVEQTKTATLKFSIRNIATQEGVFNVDYSLALTIGGGGNPDS